MGAAAFWIALAAVLISSKWFQSRSEAMKHETIRRIVDQTGQIDESKLKELFQPPPPLPLPGHWFREPEPGTGYRHMRVAGTLVLFVALGLVVFFSFLYLGGIGRHEDALIGYGAASVIALFGVGLFYASRLLPPPLPQAPQDDRA